MSIYNGFYKTSADYFRSMADVAAFTKRGVAKACASFGGKLTETIHEGTDIKASRVVLGTLAIFSTITLVIPAIFAMGYFIFRPATAAKTDCQNDKMANSRARPSAAQGKASEEQSRNLDNSQQNGGPKAKDNRLMHCSTSADYGSVAANSNDKRLIQTNVGNSLETPPAQIKNIHFNNSSSLPEEVITVLEEFIRQADSLGYSSHTPDDFDRIQTRSIISFDLFYDPQSSIIRSAVHAGTGIILSPEMADSSLSAVSDNNEPISHEAVSYDSMDSIKLEEIYLYLIDHLRTSESTSRKILICINRQATIYLVNQSLYNSLG